MVGEEAALKHGRSRKSVAVDESSAEVVPRRIRSGIRVFLALFILTGLFEVQVWPLTGWKLFSHLRSVESSSLATMVVDRSGRTRPFDIGSMPAFRNFSSIAPAFEKLSAVSEAGVCRAWLSSVQRVQPNVVGLRVLRVRQTLVPRVRGRPAAPPATSVVFSCPDPR
jgi:hypothetical protein